MALISNTRITYDYEILERFEAGIELLGFEVKSVRAKHGSLQGSYVLIKEHNQVVLMNTFIPPYQEKNTPAGYDAYRPRNLLISKREILQLRTQEKKAGKGLTLVPISMYNKGRVIKVEVALVRGKKTRDKRETIKKRETDREISREFKSR